MAIRRIGIMGAGSIGSVVGGMLTKAGHDVTFIDQWTAHVDAMKADGLRLSGTCGDHVVPVKALHLYEAQGIQEPFDVAVLAVKGYDTEGATAFIILKGRYGISISTALGQVETRKAKGIRGWFGRIRTVFREDK